MKNIKKDIILYKYKKIEVLKNKIKKFILHYYFQNLNLNLKTRQIFKLLMSTSLLKNIKKKNLCTFSARKKGINRNLNLSRHKINKMVKLGLLDSYFIN